MSSNTGNNDSNALNQWNLPEGPNGDGSINEWDIYPLNGKLKCKNQYSGYQLVATECCPETYHIELSYHNDPTDSRVPMPVEQWSEETYVETEDVGATLYQMCVEYSPEPRQSRQAHILL